MRMLRVHAKTRKRQAWMASQSGMSIVEVIIVLVLIGVVVLPLSRLSVTNSRSVGRYARMTQAVYDAQNIAEQIWADYKASGAGRGYTWVRNNWSNKSGTISYSNNTYSVQISSPQTSNGVTYVVVTVSVTGSGLPSPARVTFWLPEMTF